MKNLFLFSLLAITVNAFTANQVKIIRQVIVDHKAPAGSSMLDAVLSSDYAFADQTRLIISIDGPRFECCPKSFQNVMTHEVHHLHQRQHNTVFVKDDPMSYAVTVSTNGDVVDDNWLLPPLSASQPWARSILGAMAPTPMLPPQQQTSRGLVSVEVIFCNNASQSSKYDKR